MDINNFNFQATEARIRPSQSEKCPRCNSMNTKFCYYNNYSLAQPRHYCKTCRRYWTQGGICRNIPIGGSLYRRNRRARTSRPRGPLALVNPTFTRHDHGSTNAGTITMYDGRGHGNSIPPMGINFPNEHEYRVSDFGHTNSTFGPMHLLSFNNNFVNFNNNVTQGYRCFLPPFPPPLFGDDAWNQEGLLTGVNQTESMFLWGFNGANVSGSFNGSGTLLPNDIGIINDQWLEGLSDYTPLLPLPPPSSA